MNLLTGPSLLALAKSIYYRYDIPLKRTHKIFQNFNVERYKRSSQLSYSMAKTIDSRKNKTRVDKPTNGDAVNPKAFQPGLSPATSSYGNLGIQGVWIKTFGRRWVESLNHAKRFQGCCWRTSLLLKLGLRPWQERPTRSSVPSKVHWKPARGWLFELHAISAIKRFRAKN